MYIEVLGRVDYLKILEMFLNAWNDILEKMDYLVKSDLKLSALFLMTYYLITIMITLAAATRRVMKLIVMNLKLYRQNNMEQANILYAKREGTTHHHSKIP